MANSHKVKIWKQRYYRNRKKAFFDVSREVLFQCIIVETVCSLPKKSMFDLYIDENRAPCKTACNLVRASNERKCSPELFLCNSFTFDLSYTFRKLTIMCPSCLINAVSLLSILIIYANLLYFWESTCSLYNRWAGICLLIIVNYGLVNCPVSLKLKIWQMINYSRALKVHYQK